jgi:protein O-mannosyl-transferase
MRHIPLEWFVGSCLVLATLAVFRPACDSGFVNFDDNIYVTENPNLSLGLTGRGVVWAFTTFHAGNWHPLTWLTFLSEYQLGGLNPHVYHATNVALHVLNVLLVFVVWRRLTGAVWPSALVAALFALHPLHAESVAWISERKDVLSTLFWMLTLLAYSRYVTAPSWKWYLLVLALFALGLMAKPMLVTLPLVLLLLDYWPLQRRPVPVREKIPLFLVAAASCVATVYAQAQWSSIQSLQHFPFWTRLGNAVVSYATYIDQTLWPAGLASFYPHPGAALSVPRVAVAAALLAGITTIVLLSARRRAYLLVGWLWYVGTLVPVIGLVQVGEQARADRYTYVPLIGIFVMLSWGLADFVSPTRKRGTPVVFCGHRSLAAAVLAGFILLSLGWVTNRQIAYWHDSITLWSHALDVDPANALAHYNLGIALEKEGKPDIAVQHYTATLEIQPSHAGAHTNLGVLLAERGFVDDAIQHYRAALKAEPGYAEAENDLGTALGQRDQLDEAIGHLQHAVALQPGYANAHYNLGFAFLQQARWPDAASALRRAVDLQGANVRFRCGLALALYESGLVQEAQAEYREAFRQDPSWIGRARRDAWRLSTAADPRAREGRIAVLLALQVCEATDQPDSDSLDLLAAAYAERKRFDEAVATARKAVAAATPDRADAIRERLRLYERGKPFRTEPHVRAAR